MRIIYTIYNFFKHRQALKKYFTANYCIEKLNTSNLEILLNNFNNIILDFDGVLAAHGALEPAPCFNKILNNLNNSHKKAKSYILSNKPLLKRQEYFSKNFPNISFIIASKKKPYPDGINQILKLTANPELNKKSKTVIIDDRLMTGILAAEIANINAIYITNPIINLKSHFIIERFFVILRFLERFLVKI